MNRSLRAVLAGFAVAATAAALLTGCSGGGGSSGKVNLSLLAPASTPGIDALVKAFEAENPDISVKIDPAPAGDDFNNLVRTRLSTGDMDDVLLYNPGSLFKALNPDKQFVDLSGEKWAKGIVPSVKTGVSTDNGFYGAPFGSTQGGGIMYNKKVYAELGLSIPKTWAEFEANSDKIKASGKTAILQALGDAWSSQIVAYGTFANVIKQDPQWAKEWEKNKRSFTKQPALQVYLDTQSIADGKWFNENYASATVDPTLKMLADGEGVQFPMLTSTISSIKKSAPDEVNDIGVFAIPPQDTSIAPQMTLWLPNAMYIPKSTTGSKLDAAKKLLAFLYTDKGCEVQTSDVEVSGPLATSACKIPSSAPALVADIQKYVDSGDAAPALEFTVGQPIVLNNHEKITSSIESGIISGTEGARQADEAAKLSAQTLGLPGW